MFFSAVGRVVAWGAILFGVLRITMAIMVLNSENTTEAASRYLAGTTGETIDKGIYAILFGIIVGVLTDISYNLRNAKNGNGDSSD